VCPAELAICTGDLDSCDVALDTCTTDLTTCDTDLGTCTTELTETTAELATCTSALATCEPTAQAFPATGQTSCWDSEGNGIDCAGTGHDGDIQAGAELSYTDTGLTIIDNNTKLEWMKQDDNGGDCASYPGYLDKDCTFTWDEAFAFVANLNANNHGGHADWRVPNVKELQSIVNYGKTFSSMPAVSSEFDTMCLRNTGCTVDDPENACSCTARANYWSSTSFASFPRAWWVVSFGTDFGGGYVLLGGWGDADVRVRAVRGGLID